MGRERQTDRRKQTGRQRQREAHRQTDTETERPVDRQTDRETETDTKGGGGGGRERVSKKVNNLVFYAQSASTVISGQREEVRVEGETERERNEIIYRELYLHTFSSSSHLAPAGVEEL